LEKGEGEEVLEACQRLQEDFQFGLQAPRSYCFIPRSSTQEDGEYLVETIRMQEKDSLVVVEAFVD
jgi:hypothetical protein